MRSGRETDGNATLTPVSAADEAGGFDTEIASSDVAAAELIGSAFLNRSDRIPGKGRIRESRGDSCRGDGGEKATAVADSPLGASNKGAVTSGTWSTDIGLLCGAASLRVEISSEFDGTLSDGHCAAEGVSRRKFDARI